jgi:hypothetical protein
MPLDSILGPILTPIPLSPFKLGSSYFLLPDKSRPDTLVSVRGYYHCDGFLAHVID